jgi:hypothetical protein
VGFFSATDVSVESVMAVFKTIRETVFLTNLRFVKVDVQGRTRKRVDIISVPWKPVTRFSAEAACSFDLNADLKVWVSSGPTPYEIKISQKSGAAAIQRIFAQQILAPKG